MEQSEQAKDCAGYHDIGFHNFVEALRLHYAATREEGCKVLGFAVIDSPWPAPAAGAKNKAVVTRTERAASSTCLERGGACFGENFY